MLSRLRYTLKSTIIYSVGNIGIKLVGLILLPLYTDKLSTEQYGMWSILEITSQVLILTVGFRMATTMLRFVASEADEIKRKTIVFTAFAFTFICVVVFNAMLHPFSSWISLQFFKTSEFGNYFSLLFIWNSLEIFNRITLDLLRVKEKPLFYITITLVKFTLVLFLNIYYIVYRDRGIDGIILGQLMGSLVMLLITIPFILKEITWKYDKQVLKEMVKYGFPLIFSGVSTLILAAGDRYLVKIFLDYHEVGVYSLGYKISNIIKIVLVQAFQLGFLPIAFNMFDKPESKRFFKKVFTYYNFILFWAGLAVALFSKEVIEAFATNPDYYEAYKYIPLLCLAISLNGMQYFFVIGLHYAKKTKRIASNVLLVLGFNILSNLILIPRFGLYGAAVSSVISGVFLVLLNYRMSQKYYPISYELLKLIMIVVLSISLYLVSTLFSNSSLVAVLILKSLLCILFPVILYFFRFYEKNELITIKNIWNTWRNPTKWKANIRRMVNEGLDNELSN